MRDQRFLLGHWVRLEPVCEENDREIECLCQKMALEPEMGESIQHASGQTLLETCCFGPPLVIRVHEGDRVVGIIANRKMSEDDDVGFISFCIVKHQKYLSAVLESLKLYIDDISQKGARKCYAEVLEFNKTMVKILSLLGVPIEARLRQHVYRAGKFWDLFVFGGTRTEWEIIRKRLDTFMPHEGPPTSLGDGTKVIVRYFNPRNKKE